MSLTATIKAPLYASLNGAASDVQDVQRAVCVCVCVRGGGECCHPDRMQVSVNRRELMHDEFPHNSVGAVYRIQLILYFSYKSFSNLNSNFKRVTSELSSRASHCHFK